MSNQKSVKMMKKALTIQSEEDSYDDDFESFDYGIDVG